MITNCGVPTGKPDLADLYQKLGIMPQAIKVIENIRRADPARNVQGRRGNVIARYPSRKMGVTIQAESHRVELAAIYKMEHDPAVLEYYDQPESFLISYEAKSGRKTTFLYTADFFVIRENSIGWEEWKTEEELNKLAEKMPNRYRKQEDGSWRYPPAEEYATSYGLSFRLCSNLEINWTLIRNLEFLQDFTWLQPNNVKEQAHKELAEIIAKYPGITLTELLDSLDVATADDLYTLLVHDQFYVNLEVEVLAEPSRVHLFRDKATAIVYLQLPRLQTTENNILLGQTANRCPGLIPASAIFKPEVGAVMIWNSVRWEVLNPGNEIITFRNETGQLLELKHTMLEFLAKQGQITAANPTSAGTSTENQPGENAREKLVKASPTESQEAMRRFRLIEPFLNGEKVSLTRLSEKIKNIEADSLKPIDNKPTISCRTAHLWIANYRQAEKTYGEGYGFVGLLPSKSQRGNRTAKLPANTLDLMEMYITEHYENIKQKGADTVYGQLIRKCEELGTIKPSFKTFLLAIKNRPHQEQVQKRQGHRAAYKYEPPYWQLEPTTPKHGDYPFHIAHLDHTELDIELVSSRNGQNLGRPWATFLTDAFTRRILAVYLSYEPPSYRACMMVLRECVRRHARLPQIIVVDGGTEFHSTYFEVFLARYEITKKTRPAAKARYGAVVERLFGTTNTQFVHNLLGNTQITKNVRQVTKTVNPKNHAVWTLEALFNRLCEYAYENYDTSEHQTLGQPPRQEEAQGLARSGLRHSRLIPYNQDFIMDTLPTTAKGTAKIQPTSGVKINGIYYWADEFRHPEVAKTNLPVRYDPYDAGIAYTFVRGRWVRCISDYYSSFRGRSEREMLLASEELRKRLRRTTKIHQLTAKDKAIFIESLEAQEILLLQRQKDAELTPVLAHIAGAAENQVANSSFNAAQSQNAALMADTNTDSLRTEAAHLVAALPDSENTDHNQVNPTKTETHTIGKEQVKSQSKKRKPEIYGDF
jgi:putative transposase